MPPAAPTHSVLGLLPLVRLAHERGVDPDRLLRAARIAPALLEEPSARVRVSSELAFVRALLERTGDAALGLEAGSYYHLAIFGALGAMVAAAPTLRAVIRLFLEHLDLTYTPFAVVFEERVRGADAEARLSFIDDVELGALRRFYLDRDLAFVIEVARTLWPETHRTLVRRVDFDYPAPEPGEAERYRRRMPCPVVFGAEIAGVVVDLSADRPRARGSALGLRLLEEQLAAGFGSGVEVEDVPSRVRRAIAGAVMTRGQRPSVQAVAASIGLPERTLRRRLSDAHTSYRALEEQVLTRLARRQLERSDASLATIAERLGYAEAASFARAFRRWTGETPRGRSRA